MKSAFLHQNTNEEYNIHLSFSSSSRALSPSFPISPHFHPHSTIALHLLCKPSLTALTLNLSKAASFVASVVSHAWSSACAALSFVLAEIRLGECEPSDDDDAEGSGGYAGEMVAMNESRVGFWDLETLIRRVTLQHSQYIVQTL